MKKVILSVGMMLFLSFGLFAQQIAFSQPNAKEVGKANVATIVWEKSEYDFGTIEKGKPVMATFEFVNSGSAPMSISKVQTSCGCTATDYTKSIIGPGEKGYVKATYNAAKEGAFNKSVVVFTTVEGEQKTLILKGFVK